MSTVVAFVALIWWIGAVGLLGLSAIAALVFPWRPGGSPPDGPTPPVTIIAPIKDLDSSFEAAQTSLFEQTAPNIEIVIASQEEGSPAAAAARDILGRHSHAAARLAVSKGVGAVSPKLDNLWEPIDQALHDVILTKDSNVLLSPTDTARLARHLQPGVGLVSAMTILLTPESPAAWVETSIINGQYVRTLMLARILGLGFGLGKVMLFRRSDLQRAGGLPRFVWALGEDAEFSGAMAELKLRTVLPDRLTYHHLGARSWSEVWNRFLRWKVIWRVQRLPVFFLSLFGSAILAAFAGALAAPVLRASPYVMAVMTLLAWFVLESLISLTKGWPWSVWSLPAFFEREVFDLMVWLRALTTSRMHWAGAKVRASTAGRVS